MLTPLKSTGAFSYFVLLFYSNGIALLIFLTQSHWEPCKTLPHKDHNSFNNFVHLLKFQGYSCSS